MIVASIDIGTNTILLLVAKVNNRGYEIISIFDDNRMPRIGKGIKQTGQINEESISKLFSVLREFKIKINEFKPEKVFVTGTNAFRIANNSAEVITAVKKEFDLDIAVISGDEEAEYAYLGAISNLNHFKVATVIDIGGSSTEIISGEQFNILSKVSLQIGSVTTTEHFLKDSPPSKPNLTNLKLELVNQFRTFSKELVSPKVVAVAGTATTIACMRLGLKEFNENLVNGLILIKSDLLNLVDTLSQLTSAQIVEKYGAIMKGREDIILAGAIILEQFMDYYQIDHVSVSTRGIRYGAIVKYLFDAAKESYSE
jgi:exopolyphosphatase/guanosine-5'-triphosphate,3'-diphosphate pyrophosphatase